MVDIPIGWKLVPTPITENMHVAAANVLVRANGLDGTPQRMLDAMLAAAPQPVGEVPMPESVAWLAALDKDQRQHELKKALHAVLFRNYSDAECWVAERLDFGSWRYSLEPLALVSDVRTYGDAREAAGYAAGGAAGVAAMRGEDAERYRWLTEDHADAATRARCRELIDRMSVMSYSAVSAAIDAALRGEVKP